jgi:hypothetical protein
MWAVVWAMLCAEAMAAPLRVVLVDFEDQTGMAAAPLLGGGIAPGALAEKGALLVAKRLARNPALSLIDRRDLLRQLDRQSLNDLGMATPVKPSVLHAAQSLRADAVIRGALLSFSSGKRIIDQGGYRTEMAQVTLRASIEAQNAVDGAIIALADGAAQLDVRQTPQVQTSLSEDEVLGLLDQAVDECLLELEDTLALWRTARDRQPRIALTVKTDADPALVEIDGILVGTTPLEAHSVYQGDHVLRIGKPGYIDVTKRILFTADTEVTVPMMRIDLTADEWAEILKQARLHRFPGEPGLFIQPVVVTEERTP